MSATVLVTGGAGYIGSHACKALARAGYEPVTFDNLSRGHAWAVKWGPLERGDLGDPAALDRVLERYRPSAVLHFAGFTYVGESVERPELYRLNNVEGSRSLLAAMARHGVDRIVFSSSAAVYGMPAATPVGEDAPVAPINPYGQTKAEIERALEESAAQGGLRSVSLRYFNAAGADPEGEAGEAHEPETHLIPLVLTAARNGGEVRVYGDDYPTADGTCIRDYIHVTDLAQAHVLALEALDNGPACVRLNLGTGQGYSVLDVVEAALQVTGAPLRVGVAPRRPGDPPVLVSRCERARELLGWTPAHSDLGSIVQTAWRWMTRTAEPAP